MKNTSGLKRDGNPGHRGGGGRPPDKLKKLCVNLVDKYKLVQRLADIAAGKPMVPAVGQFGPIIDSKTKLQVMLPAPIKAQAEAISELLDRGYGKSIQMLSNDPENPFDSAIFVLPAKSVGHKGGIS